jgi:serine/threonine protein kinase
MADEPALLRERRLSARMLARGEHGLAETLLALKGVSFSGRYRFDSLWAVGGEGAVYLVHDAEDPSRPLVGKVPLHATHRPFDLTSQVVRERRRLMRLESVLLETNGSPWMPEAVGAFQFRNPALPARRGGVFVEAEPVLVMERLPGIDLDRWLTRAHAVAGPGSGRGAGPVLDRIAAEILGAVADLRGRGWHYADLRPGNIRLLRRPERHVRLLDAGSLVAVDDRSGRFPHVPAYLPPKLFTEFCAGRPTSPDDATVATMAGRTVYEIATGDRVFPGEHVDTGRLETAPVHPAVVETVALLCAGEFADVRAASEFLAARGVRAPAAPLSRPAGQRRAARPTALLGEVASQRPAAPAPQESVVGAWEPASFLVDDVPDVPPAPPAAVAAPPRARPSPGARAVTHHPGPRTAKVRVAAPRPARARPAAAAPPWWRRLIGRLRRGR